MAECAGRLLAISFCHRWVSVLPDTLIGCYAAALLAASADPPNPCFLLPRCCRQPALHLHPAARHHALHRGPAAGAVREPRGGAGAAQLLRYSTCGAAGVGCCTLQDNGCDACDAAGAGFEALQLGFGVLPAVQLLPPAHVPAAASLRASPTHRFAASLPHRPAACLTGVHLEHQRL